MTSFRQNERSYSPSSSLLKTSGGARSASPFTPSKSNWTIEKVSNGSGGAPELLSVSRKIHPVDHTSLNYRDRTSSFGSTSIRMFNGSNNARQHMGITLVSS